MASSSLKFEFVVPKELRKHKSPIPISEIKIEGDDFVIEFLDTKEKPQKIKSYITGDKRSDVESVRDLVESKLSVFFDEAAAGYCAGKVSDAIDRYYDKEAAYAIEQVKKHQRAKAAKLDAQSGNGNGKFEKEKPIYAVRKYSGISTTSPNGQGLAEAILINGGHPVFASTINSGTSVTFFEELETEDMKLRPPTKLEYPPESAYEYESEDEFMKYITYAQENETVYSLYRDTRIFYTKHRFADTDPHNSTLLTLYTIASYFQDKFSTVPYIWLIGDNGSGKNSILITYAWLGYRVFYMAGATGANMCEYLGTVEEGEGTLAEDENDNMDKDPYKRLLYMTGYASGSCVPKILDGNTKGREQMYYRSYCQKMSASENLPSVKYSKGVLDRTFIIKCVKGFPAFNVKATKKKTKTPEIIALIDELKHIRKRLFAFRLVHYDDAIEEIKNISINGRGLELTESALQLFYKYLDPHSKEDNKTFYEDILPTLSSFLSDRVDRRSYSLEARLYSIIKSMIDASDGKTSFDNETLYNTIMVEMEGKELPNKTNMFYVDDLGITVTRTKLMKVLREKFKAHPGRVIFADGSTKRGHEFVVEALERVKASYEDVSQIKILETTPSPNPTVTEEGDDHNNGNENSSSTSSNSINTLEDTSDQVNQVNQVPDQYGTQNNDLLQELDRHIHEEVTLENTTTDLKNSQKGPIDCGENTHPISITPGLGGLPGQTCSIEDIIISIMNGYNGNKQDSFTLSDFMFKVIMLPVQHPLHCDVNEAEQKLQALIEEGKVVQVENDRFQPSQELSKTGGA
jgi:CRISPR/Cas system CSM-associated protein Csm2 small subunit